MSIPLHSNENFYRAICNLNEAHDSIMDAMRHDRTIDQKQRLMNVAYSSINRAFERLDQFAKTTRGNTMNRKLKREIKAAYREIYMLDRVSDTQVFDAYIGEFETDRDFINYLNDNCEPDVEGNPAFPHIAENLDAHGMWTLQHSDLAHDVINQGGHFFKRNP